jgi:signal transduction histidine kinase
VAAPLHGATLGRQVSIFEDVKGVYDIRAVSAPSFQSRFVASTSDTPSMGFSSSVYWIRFSARNSGDTSRAWLLEVGYPGLDHVTLFTPKGGAGFEARVTGDAYPFAQREIAYRNFLFNLEEAPHGARTFYLRVSSTGSVYLPLTAWSMRQFVEGHHLEWTVLCIFYGVVLIMAFYNASIYVLARQQEFLYYVFFLLALGFLQLTLTGHTFQYLLPNHSWLANRALPVSIALAVSTGIQFAIVYVGFKSFALGLLRLLGLVAAMLGVAIFVLPYQPVLRGLVGVTILTCLIGFIEPINNLKTGHRRAKLYLIGWSFFLAGAIATLLRLAGLVPTNMLTSWSMQIGAIVQVAFLSTALADSINVMRADLAALNDTLSDKVTAQQEALHRAEEATERAERATRIKDEFMATMSHEFRTPLNAIINIPLGLLGQFPMQRFAICGACSSTFQLEQEEVVSATLPCPECSALGSLSERLVQRYVGQPAHTARYLSKIERSGTHLLQIVDGILDFSKLEAGHLSIARERTAVASLVQEAIEHMSDMAERSQVQLVCNAIPPEAHVSADPLRIRQVLINVIGNAIKFSGGSGKVTVEVREQGDTYRFSVRDQGIGIAKENLETVFLSFEQVHKGNTRKYGGTGLGLSIARSLVRMHGGDMWVESKLGLGATFFFSIPKEVAVASAGKPAASGQLQRPSGQGAALQENVS